MAYVTTLQLTERYGERMLIDLTDRDTPGTGAIVQSVIDRAITNTEAVIDGYLKELYALPLAEVPALIRDIAEVIAIYKLQVYAPPDKIADDYKEAMRQLEQIAKGVISLPLPDGTEAETKGGTGAQMTDRARPFTEDNMKGFI